MITNTPPSAANQEKKGSKKIAIILNGISLKKKFFYTKVLPSLSQLFNVEVFETRTKSDAVSLASKAVDKGYDILVAAGGDGTLNQVVNGVLQKREGRSDLPAIGVFPIGSGNDFARTLKISRNVQELCDRIKSFHVQKFDVGKILYTKKDGQSSLCYFINVADAGMGPEVVRRLTDSDRPFGSAVAYYVAILSTFFTYKPMLVKIKTPDWSWENKLRTVAIGNGKFYGHGLCIAPDAKPDDGIFSTFICGDVSVLEFIQYSGALKNSKIINHSKVSYASVQHIEMTAESPCGIEADGELLGFLPATIDIIPGSIKFLC